MVNDYLCMAMILKPNSKIPRLKKAHQVRSNMKVLFTVFFDCNGVMHHKFLPQGREVSKEYHLEVMHQLRKLV